MKLTTDAAGLASTASANSYAGFYPRKNNSTTATASTSQGSVSGSVPSIWSTAYSQPSSSNRSSFSSGSVSNSIAPPSGVVPPYLSPTGSAANTASSGTFSSGGYGSLPTGTGAASNGIPPYPYPSAIRYSASRGGSLPVGTGGYYPAGNGTSGDSNSTIHSTRFITETPAPCTINAIGANVYYWDTHRLNVTQCVGQIHGACTNRSIPAPYIGAPATRTISTWTTLNPVRIPTSTSSLTIRVSGYTNPTKTATDYVYDHVTYSKTTFVDEATQLGHSITIPVIRYSISTPPITAPSDILMPDMTEAGWTYAYTATYPQSNVLYSVFEIESQYATPGRGPIPTIATSTATFTAPVPFLDPYTGSLIGNYSVPSATGPIEPDTPSYLAWAGAGDYVARCAAGTYRGIPTVEVVLVTHPIASVFGAEAIAHVSILGGLTPTETKPTPKVTVDTAAVAPLLGPIPAATTAEAVGSQQTVAPSIPNNQPGASNGQGGSNQGGSGSGGSNQSGSLQGGSQGIPSNGGSNAGPTQGGPNQGGSNHGGPIQGGSNQGSPQGGSNGSSGQSGSNNAAVGQVGTSSGSSGSPHQVAPGGHQGGSNQAGLNSDTGLSGAGAGNGQGGSNGPNGQGAQGGSGSGTGAIGGQGGSGNSGSSGSSGDAPQSFETTVGNIPISVSGNTAIINGETFAPTPGSPAITAMINNQPVVVSPSQVIAGGQIVSIPAAAAAPTPTGPPLITFGASIITANPSSQFVIAGQTLYPGSAIEVSGTKLSLGPSAASIVIGGSTVVLNHPPHITPAPGPPAFIFHGSTFTANPTAPVVIAGQTLPPGGPAITVSGTRLSLAASASQVIIGGATIPLNTNTSPITLAPALTIGGQTITANPASQYVIAGQTLVPGGPAITVSGTRLSLASSASQLLVGSSTIPLIAQGFFPTLTIAGQTLTANPSGRYIIDGQTFAPGGPAITISGTRISLGPSASTLVMGSNTLSLSAGAGQVTAYPTVTIGSETVTANAQGQYIVGGQTLTPGGVITVSGTPVSLAPGASDVVLGTSTEGLGGAIMGGFGSTAGAMGGPTGPIEGFKGEATTARRRGHFCVVLGVVVAVWIVS